MPTSESTGLIRIISFPDGEAPWKVRYAWFGLILPCDPYRGYPDTGLDRGVVSGKTVARNKSGYSVPQDQAIAILEKERPSAAAWWKAQGYPHPGEYFCFAEDEAMVISDVTDQEIHHITEEMQGHSDR